MASSTSELRLAWAFLVATAAAVVLSPAEGPGVPVAWGLLAAAGSLVLLQEPRCRRAAEAITVVAGERRRLQAAVLLALLGGVAAIFSPSAALFLATGLAALLLWQASRRPERARPTQEYRPKTPTRDGGTFTQKGWNLPGGWSEDSLTTEPSAPAADASRALTAPGR